MTDDEAFSELGRVMAWKCDPWLDRTKIVFKEDRETWGDFIRRRSYWPRTDPVPEIEPYYGHGINYW